MGSKRCSIFEGFTSQSYQYQDLRGRTTLRGRKSLIFPFLCIFATLLVFKNIKLKLLFSKFRKSLGQVRESKNCRQSSCRKIRKVVDLCEKFTNKWRNLSEGLDGK